MISGKTCHEWIPRLLPVFPETWIESDSTHEHEKPVQDACAILGAEVPGCRIDTYCKTVLVAQFAPMCRSEMQRIFMLSHDPSNERVEMLAGNPRPNRSTMRAPRVGQFESADDEILGRGSVEDLPIFQGGLAGDPGTDTADELFHAEGGIG